MQNGIFFSIISFIYCIFICILFFSKDKIKSKENDVFARLLIINLIGLFIEVVPATLTIRGIITVSDNILIFILKMSGVELLKKLKEFPNFNIPVVALTTDAIQGKSNKYIEVGFSDYISKPIDENELKSVLFKFLNDKDDIKNIQDKTVERDI